MKFRDKFDIAKIIGHIMESRRVENGVVSKFYPTSQEWESVLISAIDFEIDDQTWAFRRETVANVLRSPDLADKFNKDDFKRVFGKVTEQRIKGKSKFRVLFEVQNSRIISQRKFSLEGSLVQIFDDKSSTFLQRAFKARMSLQNKLHGGFKYVDYHNSRPFVVTVSACGAHDAYERAARVLKAILGFSNFLLNQKIVNLFTNPGKSRALSGIILVPVVTVHDMKGALSLQGYWDEDWNEPTSFTYTSEDEKWFQRDFVIGLKKIRANRWRRDVLSRFVEYYDAFSNPNFEDSFLEGWRLLEKIAGDGSTKTESIVARSSFFFPPGWNMKEIALHLSARRNSISHGHRVNANDNGILVNQINQLIKPIFEEYAYNFKSFASQDELWEFTELPTDPNKISQKHGQLIRVKKFIS